MQYFVVISVLFCWTWGRLPGRSVKKWVEGVSKLSKPGKSFLSMWLPDAFIHARGRIHGTTTSGFQTDFHTLAEIEFLCYKDEIEQDVSIPLSDIVYFWMYFSQPALVHFSNCNVSVSPHEILPIWKGCKSDWDSSSLLFIVWGELTHFVSFKHYSCSFWHLRWVSNLPGPI